MQFDFVPTFHSAEEEQATSEDNSAAASENAVPPWKLACHQDVSDGVSIKKGARLVRGFIADQTIMA